MHRAFSLLSRSSRNLKLWAPSISTDSPQNLNVSDQEEKEDNQHTKRPNMNYFLKGALIGFVMMVGQKIDDTLANMFFWGNSMEVFSYKEAKQSKKQDIHDPDSSK